MTFNKWLDTFIEEKGINLEQSFEAEGPGWGTNVIPYGVVVERIKTAPPAEKAKIKDILVKIDFKKGDVLPFLRHLGKALAL